MILLRFLSICSAFFFFFWFNKLFQALQCVCPLSVLYWNNHSQLRGTDYKLCPRWCWRVMTLRLTCGTTLSSCLVTFSVSYCLLLIWALCCPVTTFLNCSFYACIMPFPPVHHLATLQFLLLFVLAFLSTLLSCTEVIILHFKYLLLLFSCNW